MESVLDKWLVPSMYLPVGRWTGGCLDPGAAETTRLKHQELRPESQAISVASPLWSRDPPAPVTHGIFESTYCNLAAFEMIFQFELIFETMRYSQSV